MDVRTLAQSERLDAVNSHLTKQACFICTYSATIEGVQIMKKVGKGKPRRLFRLARRLINKIQLKDCMD